MLGSDIKRQFPTSKSQVADELIPQTHRFKRYVFLHLRSKRWFFDQKGMFLLNANDEYQGCRSSARRAGRKKPLVHHYLVGGLEHFLFSIVYGIILPIDFHIFQRGRAQPPTSYFPHQSCQKLGISSILGYSPMNPLSYPLVNKHSYGKSPCLRGKTSNHVSEQIYCSTLLNYESLHHQSPCSIYTVIYPI